MMNTEINVPKGCTHINYNPKTYHVFSYYKKAHPKSGHKWMFFHPTWNSWELCNNAKNKDIVWKLKSEYLK